MGSSLDPVRLRWLRIAVLGIAVLVPGTGTVEMPDARSDGIEKLPPPRLEGPLSVEAALARRRSVREFGARPLGAAEIGQLAWAAQGITHGDGLRAAPSAGALYPLELYVATAGGLYRYDPREHGLRRLAAGDPRPALARAALDQDCVGEAPAVFAITAVVARTARRYGRERAARYAHLEAGHAAQNLLLEAVALGLGAVPVGAFDDAALAKALALPPREEPLYLVPVGLPR